MIKTTVVIPNYNGIAYLENCLSFLKRSRETEFDTIVVDNGSTDGSLELVQNKFPHVKLITFKENTGFCKAVNAGIKESKTEFVLLLNNDTIVDYYFVTKLEKEIEKYPSCFSVSAKMLSMKQPEIIDDAGDFYCALGWAYGRGKGKDAHLYTKENKIFAACGGAAIYRKSVFQEIGYFDELHFAYLEDIDIGYRAKIYGYQNRYCPDAIVYHAGSGSSGSRYNKFKVNLSSRNNVYMIIKNMPLLQCLINLPFLLIGFLVKTAFFIKKGFGLTYIKGMYKGIVLAWSKEGRKRRIHFKFRNLKNYMKIQLELWWNMILRIQG